MERTQRKTTKTYNYKVDPWTPGQNRINLMQDTESQHRKATPKRQTERHSKVIDSGRHRLSDTEVFPAMAFPIPLKPDISSVMLNNLTNVSVPGTSV